jgi:hypothetical protein
VLFCMQNPASLTVAKHCWNVVNPQFMAPPLYIAHHG